MSRRVVAGSMARVVFVALLTSGDFRGADSFERAGSVSASGEFVELLSLGSGDRQPLLSDTRHPRERQLARFPRVVVIVDELPAAGHEHPARYDHAPPRHVRRHAPRASDDPLVA